MGERRCWLLLALAVAIGCGTGCVRLVGPEDIRDDLSRQAGVKLRQQTGFTVTRSGIWLARQFVDPEEVPLKGIRRVEIGIYEVRGLKKSLEAQRPLDLTIFRDWAPVVTVRDHGEEVSVLSRTDEQGEIRGIMIVVAEEDEWVLVRVRGRLDRIFEAALEQAFADVHRGDLYAKTRVERGMEEAGPADDRPEPAAPAVDGGTEALQRPTSFKPQE
ncbi:MAG TPA: DUF4252 domain-containing protein [Candidatus Polarisedimenticolaceae bacterium]|nr:DUF4252 domain-containing protein [Candidatus Polarisedimenticolaceae bacterium]